MDNEKLNKALKLGKEIDNIKMTLTKLEKNRPAQIRLSSNYNSNITTITCCDGQNTINRLITDVTELVTLTLQYRLKLLENEFEKL